jgi:hypothetical protein
MLRASPVGWIYRGEFTGTVYGIEDAVIVALAVFHASRDLAE